MLTALAVAAVLAAAPSPEELAAEGEVMARELTAGKDAFAARFDAELFGARMTKGLDLPKGMAQGVVKGARNAGQRLGDGALRFSQDGGQITFRGVTSLDGEPAVRLRAVDADGRFTYFELVLVPGTAGALKLVDYYELSAGEKLSDQLRRFTLMGAAEMSQGLADKLLGKEKVFMDSLPKLQAVTKAMRENQPAVAYEAWRALPKELREQKSIMRLGVSVAQQVDDKSYEQEMTRFLTLYPTDPASAVMAVDFYTLKKKWDRVKTAIDGIEARVGSDDGWLEVLRGNIADAAGHLPEAKGHFKKAVEREPGLAQGYWGLIGAALAEKDWAATAKWLRAVERQAGVELGDHSTVPEYAAFVASKEGKAYQKRRAAR